MGPKTTSLVQEKHTDNQAERHSRRWQRMIAMYVTMVIVSTLAIHFLEHASWIGAFRTAVVAAIGKTVAANWVSDFF